MPLTSSQQQQWDENGWLCISELLNNKTVSALDTSADELVEWSVNGSPGIHHFEQTSAGATIARSEQFADDHTVLGEFVRGDILGNVLQDLFGEPSVLFKEKINYKQPGGGGFAPHQDAPAYRFVDHHISAMVPLDPATVESGCLYFAPGHTRGLISPDGRGRVEQSVANTLAWEPILAVPGDVVFFDSYAPHYSTTNTTDRARRVLYLTYNAKSRGDFRTQYYEDKQAEFDAQGNAFDGERVRISINDDFLGIPVSAPRATSNTDTIND